MLNLFVWAADSGGKVPAMVEIATEQDLAAARDWQASWTTPFALKLPDKVALRRVDDGELLGLMPYELDGTGLAVEVIYNGKCPSQQRESPSRRGWAQAVLWNCQGPVCLCDTNIFGSGI